MRGNQVASLLNNTSRPEVRSPPSATITTSKPKFTPTQGLVQLRNARKGVPHTRNRAYYIRQRGGRLADGATDDRRSDHGRRTKKLWHRKESNQTNSDRLLKIHPCISSRFFFPRRANDHCFRERSVQVSSAKVARISRFESSEIHGPLCDRIVTESWIPLSAYERPRTLAVFEFEARRLRETAWAIRASR